MPRKVSKSTKPVKSSGPRRTVKYKTYAIGMQGIQRRFSLKIKPFLNDSFATTRDATSAANAILIAFPDYKIETNCEGESLFIHVTEFPYQLITDNYTGESSLSREELNIFLHSVEYTRKKLADLGHPDPFTAACEQYGITKRAMRDLAVLNAFISEYWYGRSELQFDITKAPIIPQSTAKIKLGILIKSQDNIEWCYKASLIGDYTTEQQALAAQELFRENAMYNKDIGAFIFDHYPKTLAVVGENEL